MTYGTTLTPQHADDVSFCEFSSSSSNIQHCCIYHRMKSCSKMGTFTFWVVSLCLFVLCTCCSAWSVDVNTKTDHGPVDACCLDTRRAVLASVAAVGSSCFCTPMKPSWAASPPIDAGEAIRRSAANIPGYGQTDVFYPTKMVGSWKMTRDVEIPGRERPFRLSYPYRFISSIEDGAVVADRGFNQAELEKALAKLFGNNADAPVSIRSYEWVQTNPNDLRLVFGDGTKKEIKVTKRATERTETTVSSSEFQRVTQEDDRGIPVISARRVVSKWKVIDDATVEALEIVYSMAGGDPLSSGAVGPSSPTILSKSRIILER